MYLWQQDGVCDCVFHGALGYWGRRDIRLWYTLNTCYLDWYIVGLGIFRRFVVTFNLEHQYILTTVWWITFKLLLIQDCLAHSSSLPLISTLGYFISLEVKVIKSSLSSLSDSILITAIHYSSNHTQDSMLLMAASFYQMEILCRSPKLSLTYLVSEITTRIKTDQRPRHFEMKMVTIIDILYNLQQRNIIRMCIQKSLFVKKRWYPVAVSSWRIREVSSGTVSVGKVICCCLCMLCRSATQGNLSDCFSVCENSGG